MIPAPTTSRSASARRPADIGMEPDTRGADAGYEHMALRVLAAFGCGIASLPILVPLLYLAIVAPAFEAALVAALFFLVLLVPGVPIALAWRWTNPGHYAVAYLMIWVPFTVLFALVLASAASYPLLEASWFLALEYGLYSLGLPLCLVAWGEWIRILRRRRASSLRRGAYAGNWLVVVAGVLFYFGGFGLAIVACGGVLLMAVGIALAVAGFLMRGSLPRRGPTPSARFPAASPPPPCPTCDAPLEWVASLGVWFCPRCQAYV